MKYPLPLTITLFCALLALATGLLPMRCAAADTAAPAVTAATMTIAAGDPTIQYSGRMSFADPKAPRMWWPGSSVSLRINSAHISADMVSASAANEFTVVVDGDCARAQNLICQKGEAVYPLVSPLGNYLPGAHTVQLWLRSETWQPVDFKGFIVDKDASDVRLIRHKKKIEFFGDSITCGYGDEGTSADNRTDANSNNYLSYGALTARALHADYRCTARSGIGVMTAWNDPVSSGITMPTYYDRLDPNVEHSWDFRQWTPDAVVINLGENDSGIFKMKRHTDPGSDADTGGKCTRPL